MQLMDVDYVICNETETYNSPNKSVREKR